MRKPPISEPVGDDERVEVIAKGAAIGILLEIQPFGI